MNNDIHNMFCEALIENDSERLLTVPKSDIHNHSSKGCRRTWLEGWLKHSLPKPPDRFGGLVGMQEWFTASIKPYCKGSEGIVLRWKGALWKQRGTISQDLQ